MSACVTMQAVAGSLPPLNPTDSNLPPQRHEVTNEEIDRIFISFLREEEMKKEKQRANSVKKKKGLGGSDFRVGDGTGNTERSGAVFDSLSALNRYKHHLGEIPTGPQGQVVPPSPQPSSMQVYGVSCISGSGCTLFTSIGLKKVGDVLPDQEKILEINTRYFRTNLKKYKF
jgi:hypothetical protein